jgi:hypothetical protein
MSTLEVVSGTTLIAGSVALLTVAVACGDAPGTLAGRAVELGSLELPIIGGLVAPNPQLDHTGALTYRIRETGATGPLCTASLIAPQTVVTANHCISVMPTFERIGIDVFWARGADFNNPIELTPIVAVAGAPASATEPGFTGYGRDVGVAHLDRPVDGVAPINIRPSTPDLLGASMVTLGFGISSAGGLVDGLRRIGRETVSAVEGNSYAALFGDFEGVVEFLVNGEVTDFDILPLVEQDPSLIDLEALRLEFDAAILMPEHEVVAGTAPGDTQSCALDSGGPLARVNASGEWEAYGVVSGGPRLERPECGFGQVFATFGPITFPFLETARAWEDPCGDVGVEGVCEGAVARRCESSFANAVRRLVDVDCGALGQGCIMSNAGAACAAAAP